VGPGILSVSPTHGVASGGNTIDIVGVDLQEPGVTMSLGGQALTLTKLGANHYSAVVPAAAQPGPVDLTITNPDTSTGVDHAAYIYDSISGAFHSLPPHRVLDTRAEFRTGTCFDTNGSGVVTCLRLQPFQQVDVQVAGGSTGVAANAIAVIVNVTAVGPSQGGYMTVFPTGTPRPTASTLNFGAGRNVSNLAQLLVGHAGKVRIYNDSESSDVVIDIAKASSRAGSSTPAPSSARGRASTPTEGGPPARRFSRSSPSTCSWPARAACRGQAPRRWRSTSRSPTPRDRATSRSSRRPSPARRPRTSTSSPARRCRTEPSSS
jgi:hypothetical protein